MCGKQEMQVWSKRRRRTTRKEFVVTFGIWNVCMMHDYFNIKIL